MMLGVMSDSHGQIRRVRSALKLLKSAGAEAVIHCGDVGGIEVLEELAGWRAWFVWGNTDAPQASWRSELDTLGLPWPDGPLDLELAGKRIAVYHGHEREFHAIEESAEHDYLLHGHTHRKADHRLGRMRIINPGAMQRAAVKTVALLDLKSDELTFLEIADG